MGVIIYNGVRSTDFGIEVATPPDYYAAQRSYRDVTVPGRNGVLHIDEGFFKNVERTYQCSFLSRGDQTSNSFEAVSTAIGGWLDRYSGYAELEDSYEPDYYRMARYVGALHIASILHEGGTFELKFDCKPQRFLKSGRFGISETSPSTLKLTNPTRFIAKPYIECTAINSAATIVTDSGSISVVVDNTMTTVVIDCEKEEIYDKDSFANLAPMTTGVFPTLHSGVNNITCSGIIDINIVPNWWTI